MKIDIGYALGQCRRFGGKALSIPELDRIRTGGEGHKRVVAGFWQAAVLTLYRGDFEAKYNLHFAMLPKQEGAQPQPGAIAILDEGRRVALGDYVVDAEALLPK